MVGKSQDQIENGNGEDEPGKLFVGGLSWETTEGKLQQYFSTFGEVVDTLIMKNAENGQSRGFGFVTFSDPDTVHEVLKKGPHFLDGRTIDPKPCNTKAALRTKRNAQYPKVFLGGLPHNTTESDVRGAFEQFGKVMDVMIMYDHEKNRCKGFGFLAFEDEESLNKCLAQHFVRVNTKRVEVKRAENRGGKSSTSWVNQNSVGLNIPSYGWGMTPGYAYGTTGATAIPYAGWVAPPSQWGPNYSHMGYPSYGPQIGAPYSNWNWNVSHLNGPLSGHSSTATATSGTPAHSVGPNTTGADLYNKNVISGATHKQEYTGYCAYSTDSGYNQNSVRNLYGINSDSSTAANYAGYRGETAQVFTKFQ